MQTDEPCYIIDDYPAGKMDPKDIDPAAIESISVLKAENALLIYGSRAANGVIIIRTNGEVNPRPDHTLLPEEISPELFALHEPADFGAGKQVIYLLNGSTIKLRKPKKIPTSEFTSIRVYQRGLKVRLLGYSEHEVVVDVILR